MAGTFTFDMSQFNKALKGAPDAVAKGVKSGLRDIKNDWEADSVDIAPLKDGALRLSIDAKASDLEVEITASAIRSSNGKQFNYAYYIHEDKGSAVTGEKKFLDVPAQQNEGKWAQWLEEEIESELKKAGWR